MRFTTLLLLGAGLAVGCGARDALESLKTQRADEPGGAGGAQDAVDVVEQCTSAEPPYSLSGDGDEDVPSFFDAVPMPDGTFWVIGSGRPAYARCESADVAGVGDNFLAHLSPELDLLYERRFGGSYEVTDGLPVGLYLRVDGSGRPLLLAATGIAPQKGDPLIGYLDGAQSLVFGSVDARGSYTQLCASPTGRAIIIDGQGQKLLHLREDRTFGQSVELGGMWVQQCAFAGDEVVFVGGRSGEPVALNGREAWPAGSEGFTIARFDLQGTLLDLRSFPVEIVQGATIVARNDGDVFYIATHRGGTWGSSVLDSEYKTVFASRLDSNIEPQWVVEAVGATNDVLGQHLGTASVTPGGGVIFALRVWTESTSMANAQLSSGSQIVELDASGQVVWHANDSGAVVRVLPDGRVLIGGRGVLKIVER